MVVAVNFDIAVVGGSVAGLSAVREISEKCDANIVIIEEHRAIGKPASSSAFTFTDIVEKYGLKNAVQRYYTRLGWYSLLGTKASFKFDGPKLAVLDYERTCSEIISKARKTRLEIYCDTRAVSLERKDDKISLELSGTNDKTIECDLLIDASGKSFLSSRFFLHRIPEFYSNPYGYELDNCEIPESHLDEISFFVGRSLGTGGGWFYPITRNVCRFGIAEITRVPVFPRGRLERNYEFAKRHMQPFARMIKNSIPRTSEAGTIPAEPMKKLVSDNIMRVGDSAGHATPHMLEGIRPSIESATLCGKVAAEAYEKHNFSKHFLQKYERTWHGQNKLLHLYLLSMAEVAFTQNDREIEESVRAQMKREDDPEAFLLGIRGWFEFPWSFLASKPNTKYLRTLVRFGYHNLRWLLE